MKYYIIAGERSGDLHASNLIKQIKIEDGQADIRGMGGALMLKEGATLFCDYNEVSYMGFIEVFLNIFTILKVLKSVKKDILHFHPDVVILVDFAGFNMKIASFARKKNIKVYYYISPKVWAWNQKRALKIKNTVDRMFVILPFEKEFFKKYNYTVDYVGNPVNDSINDFIPDPNFRQELQLTKPVIALLPGSRKQEVENMLRILKQVPTHFPEYEFIIAGVSNLSSLVYDAISAEHKIRIVIDKTYDLLSVADAAIVSSGTATLETALLGVPQIVVYKTSAISYAIAKMLIKVKYISLVNLIADKEVVKELIQEKFSEANIVIELTKILSEKKYRTQLVLGYSQIKNTLGEKPASLNTAKLIVQYLKK